MPTETSEKYADIAENGPNSKYWDAIAGTIPWANKSAASQMYVAGEIHGFYHSEIMRLVAEKEAELLTDFEKTGFFYWKDFFAERRKRRPEIVPETEKERDVFRYGKHSQYWEEFTRDLPWDSDSPEAKLYVAAKLYGYPHSEILNLIKQQTGHGDLGFFGWRDVLEEIREQAVEPQEPIEEFDVLQIPYERYRLVATYKNKQNGRFSELFSVDGELNEDFLKAIHFNATHSMSGTAVTKGADMDGFIVGTLTGCIGAGIEEVKRANKSMQEEEAKIRDGTYDTEMAARMQASARNRESLLSKLWGLFTGLF